jgi:hypothetical protein
MFRTLKVLKTLETNPENLDKIQSHLDIGVTGEAIEDREFEKLEQLLEEEENRKSHINPSTESHFRKSKLNEADVNQRLSIPRLPVSDGKS